MQLHDELIEIMGILDQRKLGYAIAKLENFGYKYPELNFTATIEQVRNDYGLMAGYWSRGYKDPQLEKQYSQLLRRVYALVSDVALRYCIYHSAYLQPVSKRVNQVKSWTVANLQNELESFVAELAMLDLETKEAKKQKQTAIYKSHQDLLSEVFDYLWLSGQWNDGMTDIFRQILLSPTVDSMAQQLIVSAITLGAMNLFDFNKFRLLVDVYRESSDEQVRQRALVGWVLSIGKDRYILYPEQKTLVDELLQSDAVCEELVELQMQLVYCANAESDNHTIQREIMPDILKHNNFNVTLNGIEEKDEDPMQDVFDPGAAERNMEKVEDGFRKMIDMQKEGRDIYFGGFSQMKRYPFFDNISNWFVPFYDNHPAISHLQDKMANIKLLSGMLAGGTFCNSDKYSFLLAFVQIVDRLPKNVTSMLSNGEMPGHEVLTSDELLQPTYIRRTYLQDLYRFFRIYPFRTHFYNPFDYKKNESWNADYVFFANSLFAGSRLEMYACKVAAFMMKRKMYNEAAEVLGGCVGLKDDYSYNLLCGNVLLHKDEMISNCHLDNLTAAEYFSKALLIDEKSEKALIGLARALFYAGDYAKAREAYSKLLVLKPDSNSIVLNYCICLVNLSEYDEALGKLYKLHYELPDNNNVGRVLARALVGACKYEQALSLYERLVEYGNKEDILNYGYCEWFSGAIGSAVSRFVAYLKKQYPSLTASYFVYDKAVEDIVNPEREFIKAHDISDTEMMMMIDLICESF